MNGSGPRSQTGPGLAPAAQSLGTTTGKIASAFSQQAAGTALAGLASYLTGDEAEQAIASTLAGTNASGTASNGSGRWPGPVLAGRARLSTVECAEDRLLEGVRLLGKALEDEREVGTR